MIPVTAVFASRADAEDSARQILSTGVPKENVILLVPGDIDKEIKSVPVSAAEQPGIGKALAGAVGAALGLAGGLELGAVASAFVPGVGPVIALGLMGAGLLGLAGAAVGKNLDEAMTEGLPEDEVFVYEDALRRGRSVVIAFAEDESKAASLRQVLEADCAETIDQAREQWWIGLRSAEQERYLQDGRNFGQDEKFYRLGFEAALHARMRCKEYDQVMAEMVSALEDVKRDYPEADVEEPFRHGYERGRDYYQALCDKHHK